MTESFKMFIPTIMTVLLAAPFLYGVYLKRQNKLTTEKLCGIILACGVMLRLCYLSYTDEHTRQHDVGEFFSEGNNYHSGYILYLMKHHHLLDQDPRDRWQFYHPPLHHIISAVILSIVKALGGDYINDGPNVLQLFTTAYSSLFAFFAYKTFKRLDIDDYALTAATMVVTFHPTLIILAGSINNDILAAMFTMAAIYFTVCWAQEKKMKDIVVIAFCIGLGMITKLTVGLIAPAVAAVFLTVLIKQRKEWKKLIVQFVVFGVICVPIGLSWSIRNLVKYGVPLNFVPSPSKDSGQYIDIEPIKRLFDFSVYQLASPFTQWKWNKAPYNEFNPIIALLKNAMFDEATFFSKSITLQSFCTALFFAGCVTAVLSVAALILLWRKKEKTPLEIKLLLTILFAVVFGNYIIFCMNYPQVCTQNMRYCVPLIFSGTAALALLSSRTRKGKRTASHHIARTAEYSMCIMSGLSVFVYTVMMFYELAMKG